MNNIVRYFIILSLLLLFQFAVLNNIAIGNGITIFVYILFFIILPFRISGPLTLLMGFWVGISVDSVFNTGGIHAFSTVLIVFLRPMILRYFNNSFDIDLSFRPGIQSMGLTNFAKYVFTIVFLHHFLVYFIELFHFRSLLSHLFIVIVNSLLTTIVCILLEALFKREKQRV